MAVSVALKTGDFRDAPCTRGVGTGTLYRLGDDTYVLRLESLKISNGSDLHVVLTPHIDHANRKDVKQTATST